MNKKTKTALIVALSLFGAGLVICLCLFTISGFDYSRFYVNINPAGKVNEDVVAEYVDKSFAGSVSSINIVTSDADIIVTLSSDDKIHLSYNNTETSYFDLKNDSSAIRLQQSRTHSIMLFGFGSDNTVELSIPENYKGSLQLSSASGDIDLSDVGADDGIVLSSVSGKITANGGACKELKADTSSGDIELSGFSTHSVSASSVSGKISVQNLEGKLSLDANTSSGDIKLRGINAHELEAETISGSISLDSVSGSEAELDTASGDVRLLSVDYRELSFDSVSGSITGTLIGTEEDYTVFVDTFSGTNDLSSHRGRGARTLELSSTSGDFHIGFEGKIVKPDKKAT